jgi:cytidylate kinase
VTHRIITLDGPAGSGKSTVAREVARRLNYAFLDTGALYRTAALAVEAAGFDVHDEQKCASVLEKSTISIAGEKTYLNGRDVSQEIRTQHISSLSSAIAVHPSVRKALLAIQRSFKGKTSFVAEGRDTGTVVFPDADIKFYLDAAPEERARRRQLEFTNKGTSVSMSQVLNDIESRDQRDSTRAFSPLAKAHDAIVVDTTHLKYEEVVEKILSLIQESLTD